MSTVHLRILSTLYDRPSVSFNLLHYLAHCNEYVAVCPVKWTAQSCQDSLIAFSQGYELYIYCEDLNLAALWSSTRSPGVRYSFLKESPYFRRHRTIYACPGINININWPRSLCQGQLNTIPPFVHRRCCSETVKCPRCYIGYALETRSSVVISVYSCIEIVLSENLRATSATHSHGEQIYSIPGDGFLFILKTKKRK